MNSPEKLSSAGTTPNKQVRGADRPSDHRGWPPEQPWLKVRTGVAKSPDTCGSHAGIYIQLITFSRKVDVKETLIHFQKIQNSPHIEAVIEATQIIDEYSMYALSTVSDSNILVEFENTVSYKVGDRVLVIGSLELNETS
ncbi:MAG: hypothetical protein ACLRSP_11215 [Flavonifractor plautii]|uniref:hypothetical protein n=1 Tax=Flavonifractor plautii TaxID=292800 RepID=UPI0012E87FA8